MDCASIVWCSWVQFQLHTQCSEAKSEICIRHIKYVFKKYSEENYSGSASSKWRIISLYYIDGGNFFIRSCNENFSPVAGEGEWALPQGGKRKALSTILGGKKLFNLINLNKFILKLVERAPHGLKYVMTYCSTVRMKKIKNKHLFSTVRTVLYFHFVLKSLFSQRFVPTAKEWNITTNYFISQNGSATTLQLSFC